MLDTLFQAWFTVLSAMSAVLMRQPYILRWLYTETHVKQGMCLSVVDNVTRDVQKLNPVFLLVKMVQPSLSQCLQHLYRIQLLLMRINCVWFFKMLLTPPVLSLNTSPFP